VIALLQRVTRAHVEVDGSKVGEIGPGILAFIGIERGDDTARADRLLERILGYRLFADAGGKMNLSLCDVNGGLLLVPQFTLAADTDKGTRPSFAPAADPAAGKQLFDHLLETARHGRSQVASGIFGADMLVTLTNDGPVTFWLTA
jgi:D-aminoacyl-tRNA deacylase